MVRQNLESVSFKSKLSHRLAVTGAWMQGFLVVGFANMAIRMNRAIDGMRFDNPDDTSAVVESISKVTQRLGEATQGAMLWGGIALLGMALFLFSVIKLRYRRAWAFWFSVFYGAALLFLFPVGTVVGLLMMSFALFARSEFLKPRPAVRVSEGGPVRRVTSNRRPSRF